MRTPEVAIEHITQPCPVSCVAACLAMVLGKEVNKVIDELAMQGAHVPLDCSQYIPYLVQNNILPLFKSGDSPFCFIHGGLYLVTINSLNIMSGSHMIILDLREDEPIVYDPAKGRNSSKHFTTEDWTSKSGERFPWTGAIELHDCNPIGERV